MIGQRWLIEQAIKRAWKRMGEGKMGQKAKGIWQALNGWKLLVGALLLLATQTLRVFGYTDVATQIEWVQGLLNYNSDLISVTGAAEAAGAIFMLVGIIHKFIKAFQQLRAGVPPADLLSVSETVKKTLLLLLLPAMLSAQPVVDGYSGNSADKTTVEEAKQPTFRWGAWAGTLAMVTTTEKTELLFGRIAGNATFDRFHFGGRIDMSRVQDGGQADPFSFRSFRDIEPTVVAYWQPDKFPCGPTVAGAVTFSIEGSDGPYEPRQYMAGGGVRCGDNSSGFYVYALGGHYGPSGAGFKAFGGLQIPADSLGINAFHGAFLVADGLPFGEGRFVRAGVIVHVPSPW